MLQGSICIPCVQKAFQCAKQGRRGIACATRHHREASTVASSVIMSTQSRTVHNRSRISQGTTTFRCENVQWRHFSSSSKDKLDRDNQKDDDESVILSDEWIPPNRPLAGDKGNAKIFQQQKHYDQTEVALEEALFHIEDGDSQDEILRKLEEALALEEEMEAQEFQQALDAEEAASTATATATTRETVVGDSGNAPGSVDWMATRRTALGEDPVIAHYGVPITEKELLTQEEMFAFLESLGGTDLTLLEDDMDQPRMGGAEGMILATVSTVHHIRSLTKTLVDHLKARKLHEVGVLGAKIGSKSFKNSMSTWNVVDCSNFVVHVMDAPTRKVLKLEDLWTGKDPLWTLNIQNEDDVDEYVAQHPVPLTHGPSPESLWDVGKLERSRFAPHSPVIANEQKQRDRRAGRRKRREMRNATSS